MILQKAFIMHSLTTYWSSFLWFVFFSSVSWAPLFWLDFYWPSLTYNMSCWSGCLMMLVAVSALRVLCGFSVRDCQDWKAVRHWDTTPLPAKIYMEVGLHQICRRRTQQRKRKGKRKINSNKKGVAWLMSVIWWIYSYKCILNIMPGTTNTNTNIQQQQGSLSHTFIFRCFRFICIFKLTWLSDSSYIKNPKTLEGCAIYF